MKQARCIGIGEVLLDLLPGGKQLGGAPANFAYHAAALGADSRVLSRVGDDALGREILARIQQLGLNAELLQIDPQHHTGTVRVELAEDGQATYVIHPNVAWDFIAASGPAFRAVAEADVVCFGSLAQRTGPSRTTIAALLDHVPPRCLRIFDINLRQDYYTLDTIRGSLRQTDILKINDSELPIVTELLALKGDVRDQIARLVEQFRLRGVAYTRSEAGSLILMDGTWSDLPGVKTAVVNTHRAGDSFTAAMAMGLLRRWPLDVIHERAARVAGFVCSQPGATPKLPDELAQLFEVKE